MRYFILILLPLLLNLSACGNQSESKPQAAKEAWQIQTIEIEYNKTLSSPFRISGMLKNESFQQAFFLVGELADQKNLASPIHHGRQATVHCLAADCHDFEMPLYYGDIKLEKLIRVHFVAPSFALEQLAAEPAAPSSNYFDLHRVWRELLATGIDPNESRFAEATYAGVSYLSISLAGKGGTRFLRVSAPTTGGTGKISYDYHLIPEGQFSSGNELGTLRKSSDGRAQITLPGGSLEFRY